MNTRHDDRRAVTYLGDGPLTDHAGYAVDTSIADGSNLLQVRVALDADMHKGIRADLPAAAVAELRDRCNTFLNNHQEQR